MRRGKKGRTTCESRGTSTQVSPASCAAAGDILDPVVLWILDVERRTVIITITIVLAGKLLITQLGVRLAAEIVQQYIVLGLILSRYSNNVSMHRAQCWKRW